MPHIGIPDSVVSPQDLARLELELVQYADWFSHNSIKHELHLAKGTAMPGLSNQALVLLKSAAKDNRLNQQRLESLLSAVRKLRTLAPTMTITLAAPAGAQLQRTITQWCRREISPSMLVEFRFNSTILGGMVVQYGSHVHDWSFRRMLLQNRKDFAGVLRNV